MRSNLGFDSRVPYEMAFDGHTYRRAIVIRDDPDRLDGDTVRLLLDLGMRVYHVADIRVADLLCAERFKGTAEEREAGRLAWLNAVDLLPAGETVHVRTLKTRVGEQRDKYGRLVGHILLRGSMGGWHDFATTMVRDGYGTFDAARFS